MGRWKTQTILGVRMIQLISVAFLISGFLWMLSDYLLLIVLVGSPVTPLSVLFIVYGTIGLFTSELTVRILARGNSTNNQAEKKSTETGSS